MFRLGVHIQGVSHLSLCSFNTLDVHSKYQITMLSILRAHHISTSHLREDFQNTDTTARYWKYFLPSSSIMDTRTVGGSTGMPSEVEKMMLKDSVPSWTSSFRMVTLKHCLWVDGASTTSEGNTASSPTARGKK